MKVDVSPNIEKRVEQITFTQREKQLEWYRMDNASTLFTFVNSKRITCLFRVSSELKSPINVAKLQEALDNIMIRFPYYHVNLRTGLFWHYWEKNDQSPKVMSDSKYPQQKIAITRKGTFPFRVRAYQNRIAVEFHHSITDGTGAITFLRALIGEYLRLQGVEVKDWLDIFRPEQKPDFEEYEDAFKKNYQPTVPDPQKIEHSFHLPNKLEPKGTYHFITGIIPIKPLLQKAKSYNVTLTEYLAAVYLDALQKVIFSHPKRKQKRLLKPIRLMVPVNLRRIYQSKTMRNFSLYVTPGIDPRLGEHSFEEIINKVYHYMRSEVTDKVINQQIARNVRGELNPLVKFTPLFLKKMFGIFIYNGLGEYLYSGVITNLGRVIMPEEQQDKITDFQFFPAPSPQTKTGCAVVSYQDKLYINWGRNIKEPSVEKFFFRKLVQEGLTVRIETN